VKISEPGARLFAALGKSMPVVIQCHVLTLDMTTCETDSLMNRSKKLDASESLVFHFQPICGISTQAVTQRTVRPCLNKASMLLVA
jgi:hypothetical protein